MANKKNNKKKKKPTPAQKPAQKNAAPTKKAAQKPAPKVEQKQQPEKGKQQAAKKVEKAQAVQRKPEPQKAVKPVKEKPVKEKVIKDKPVREKKNREKNTVRKAKDPALIKKIRMIAIAVLAVLLVCSIPLAVVSRHNEKLAEAAAFEYAGIVQRSGAFNIEIDEAKQAERVKATKRHGQKKAFDFFCESYIDFSDRVYGSLLFGNPASNDCVLVCSILDENDTLLYRSDGVLPGKYVSQIRLFGGAEPGEHECRLYVNGYDRSTKESIGVQYTDITIRIGGTSNG